MEYAPVRHMMRVLAVAVATHVLLPLTVCAQDSLSHDDSSWRGEFLGGGYGAPNGWFLSYALAEGHMLTIAGRVLMLEVGRHGTRLGAGYALWAEGFGAVARITALRTYDRPQWVAPNRTLLGPEIRLAVVTSFGIALLWDVGPRPRSGAPLVAYSISFVL